MDWWLLLKTYQHVKQKQSFHLVQNSAIAASQTKENIITLTLLIYINSQMPHFAVHIFFVCLFVFLQLSSRMEVKEYQKDYFYK